MVVFYVGDPGTNFHRIIAPWLLIKSCADFLNLFILNVKENMMKAACRRRSTTFRRRVKPFKTFGEPDVVDLEQPLEDNKFRGRV